MFFFLFVCSLNVTEPAPLLLLPPAPPFTTLMHARQHTCGEGPHNLPERQGRDSPRFPPRSYIPCPQYLARQQVHKQHADIYGSLVSFFYSAVVGSGLNPPTFAELCTSQHIYMSYRVKVKVYPQARAEKWENAVICRHLEA